jgi:hypothetical protein
VVRHDRRRVTFPTLRAGLRRWAAGLAFPWLLIIACETGSEDDGPPPLGLEEEECAILSDALCSTACGCDCQLTWPGSPAAFDDAAMCEATLVASCDGSAGSEAEGSTCAVDIMDALAEHQCGTTLQLPDSCKPFFGG